MWMWVRNLFIMQCNFPQMLGFVQRSSWPFRMRSLSNVITWMNFLTENEFLKLNIGGCCNYSGYSILFIYCRLPPPTQSTTFHRNYIIKTCQTPRVFMVRKPLITEACETDLKSLLLMMAFGLAQILHHYEITRFPSTQGFVALALATIRGDSNMGGFGM